ncbi:hypothetical protein D9615_003336 [Tricholomella constricta]|uniref:CRIB domain-containing protein n=1 Tax=Tricholomella constricta TaxID=117010 RepID=A0A8H5M7U7_9AGAR|nr:hypothetical protein D9615_003336 [Tricholomella constricta]
MSSKFEDPRDAAQETPEILPYTWHRESTTDTLNTMGIWRGARSCLSPDTYTILAVASARIYHAQLNTKVPEWCYSRMRGTLVFGMDSQPADRLANRFGAPPTPNVVEPVTYWFRLLEAASGKPTWMFKVHEDFVYELDRPFFHAFQGRSRRFGFLFEDDDEANALAKEVISQTCPPRPVKKRSLSLSMRSKSPSGNARGPIFPPMVSLPTPNSFAHVAHVGLNKDGVIEASKGIDPSWKAVLEGHGLQGNRTQGSEQVSFGEGFWRVASNVEGMSTKGVIHQVAPEKPEAQTKTRRRMPASSFTML